MELSELGQKLTSRTGILELMDDLGRAMADGENICMLGGGNPARVPAMNRVYRERMNALLADGDAFERMIGDYDTPQGKLSFIEALADALNARYNWQLSPNNIAITNGSQTAFFCLFNMLAGKHAGGQHKQVLLPLTPEYIGYADQGCSHDMFVSSRPQIREVAPRTFKYFVDFDALSIGPDTAAICVSRPTNPTGNVLTDEEISKLAALAAENDIPLLIDNAYGAPFPNILFAEVTPVWNEHIVLSLSLSKVGIPSARTGIVIARQELIEALTAMNAVISLASCGIGCSLTSELIASGELFQLSTDVIRPFYQARAETALAHLHAAMDECVDYAVHKCEGSMFLWVWFRNLPITTAELYQRLKAKGVLVVPGCYFFPGLSDDWPHRNQCIRVNYGQDPEVVKQGLTVIAEEAKALVQGAS